MFLHISLRVLLNRVKNPEMIRNLKKEMFMNKYAHEHQIISTLDA